jgi:hypothetical protein
MLRGLGSVGPGTHGFIIVPSGHRGRIKGLPSARDSELSFSRHRTESEATLAITLGFAARSRRFQAPPCDKLK